MRTRRNNKIQQHYVAQWLQKQMFIRANKNMFFFVEFDRSDPIEITISMNNLVTADHQRDDVVSSINSCQIQFRWQFSWLANNIGAIDPINWIRVEVRCVCVCVCVLLAMKLCLYHDIAFESTNEFIKTRTSSMLCLWIRFTIKCSCDADVRVMMRESFSVWILFCSIQKSQHILCMKKFSN